MDRKEEGGPAPSGEREVVDESVMTHLICEIHRWINLPNRAAAYNKVRKLILEYKDERSETPEPKAEGPTAQPSPFIETAVRNFLSVWENGGHIQHAVVALKNAIHLIDYPAEPTPPEGGSQ